MSLGKLTKFRLKTGATYVEVAEVIGLGGLSPTRDTEDVTEFGGDATDQYRRYDVGLIEPGEQELTIRYSDTTNPGLAALMAAFNAGTTVDCQLCYPFTAKPAHQYKALVTSVGTEIPIDKRMSRKIKLKITGKIEEVTWV